MYYNGIYHLFYQYNPKGAVWGNIVWAHSVSTDLINWKPLPPAIYPSKPFDQYGTWSGSATILPGNKPIILYTGIIDKNNTQVQNYAIPANYSDPYLQKWIKPNNNPLVFPVGVNKTVFRDPTTAWFGKDGHWRILVGGRRKYRGMAHLYRSRDFMKWTKAQYPLHSPAMTGMWECPDFYPVSLDSENGLEVSVIEGNIKHVLKVSLDETRYEYYTIGKYFWKIDKYVPDNTSVDSWAGHFSMLERIGRILWGWANESNTSIEAVKKGWTGIQTIPRKVWLDKSEKQLVQWPVEELETRRRRKVHLSN
ncbi:hypothetical protein HYC85_006800 [Camellia sinensis]|uniref:Glycosyl hydrolase family 32 N-terminal domain-containing protein n=1 Tax=Camellia sinensis TaxID=4442 RepID=A0A7J7HPL1_CAMSI|nr:hypothetical protein HYC85_006800 [Camellia sinensis]